MTPASPGGLFSRVRRRRLTGVLLVAALVAGAFAGGRAWFAARSASAALSLRGRVIAIDPGHGGIDPGAIGAGGVNEDTITLAVSLQLAAMLERAGAIVVLTRTGEVDLAGTTTGGPAERKRLDLRARVALINASAADVVVGVHANHFSDPSQHGAQTFYNDQRFGASKALAKLMQANLERISGETARDISEHINHYLLNYSAMPGVTVEIGFLSNPREARLLQQPAYQQRLAYAMFSALARWFARLPQTAPPPASSSVAG